jgi:hypothetical protein
MRLMTRVVVGCLCIVPHKSRYSPEAVSYWREDMQRQMFGTSVRP